MMCSSKSEGSPGRSQEPVWRDRGLRYTLVTADVIIIFTKKDVKTCEDTMKGVSGSHNQPMSRLTLQLLLASRSFSVKFSSLFMCPDTTSASAVIT